MKKIIIFILLLSSATTTFAMTMQSEIQSNSANAAVTIFALTGTITRFDRAKSLITISGKSYILNGKGQLKDSDLKPGARVHYNTEKSPKDKMARVTKLWVNSK